MRAVVQRVLQAKVSVTGETVGAIGPGMLVLLGVGAIDQAADAKYLAEKLVNLRIFSDSAGRMNCSALQLGLPLLIVSQFTLYGDCRQGRRPSFSTAALPEQGEALYHLLCQEVEAYGLTVAQGRFRSQMVVELCNDGPVTLILDSQRQF